MNKAYRLVWNETRQMLAVVAENSRSRGKQSGRRNKRALVAAAALGVGLLAPMGGVGDAWALVCTDAGYDRAGLDNKADPTTYTDSNGSAFGSIACGGSNTTTDANSASYPAQAGTYSIAIGSASSAAAEYINSNSNPAVRDGNGNLKDGEAVAIGQKAQAGYQSTALGANAKAIGSSNAGATAVGHGAWAQGAWGATALGPNAQARGADNIAIGRDARALGTAGATGEVDYARGQNIAIGADAEATSEQTIALGANTRAVGPASIAIGGDDVGDGRNTYALISASDAIQELQRDLDITDAELQSGQYSIPTGDVMAEITGNKTPSYEITTKSQGAASIALGFKTRADEAASNAIGLGAWAKGRSSMAAGTLSAAQGAHSTALGSAAQAIEENSVSLGSLTVANRGTEEKILLTKSGAASTAGYNVLDDAAHSGTGAGDSTWTPTLAAVSVGSAPARLYFASASGDATTTQVTEYPAFRKSDGSLTRDYMDSETYQTYEVAYDEDSTVVTHTRRITNVAAGAADTDAVNVAQLKLVRESSWQVGGNLVQDDDGDITGADGNKYKYVNGPYNVQQGDVVNFVDGDGTTAVTSNTTTITNPDGTTTTINQPSVTYNVNKTPVQPNSDTGTAYGWCDDENCTTKLAWDGENFIKPDGTTYTGDVYNINGDKVDADAPNKTYVTAGDVVNTINNTYWNAVGDADNVTDGKSAPIKAGNNVIFQSTDKSIQITQKDNEDGTDGTTFDFQGMKVQTATPGSGGGNDTATTIYAPDEDGNWKTYDIGGGSWTIGNPDTNAGSSTGSVTVNTGDTVNFKDGSGTTVTITPKDGDTPASVAYNVLQAGAHTPTTQTGGQVGPTIYHQDGTTPVTNNNPAYWTAQQTADAINDAYWNVQGYNGATAAQTNAAPVKAGDTVKVVANRGLALTQNDKELGLTATYAWTDDSDPSNPVTKIRSYNEDGSYEDITIGPNSPTSITAVGVTSSGGKVVAPTDPNHQPGDPDYDEHYADKPVTASSVTDAVNNTYWTATGDGAGSTPFNVKPGNTVNFKGGDTKSQDGSLTGGKNIQVVASGDDTTGDLEFVLSDNIGLTDQGSVTIGDTNNGPSTEIKNGEINFTPTSGGDPDGKITGLGSHFTDVTAGDTTMPGGNAPNLWADNKNDAATLGDVMNAGWNLQANGTAVDHVTHGNTVNFTSANKSVTIIGKNDGTTNTIDFSVDTSSIQTSIVNSAFDSGEGTNYEVSTDPTTGNPVVKFNVNKATLNLAPGESVTAQDNNGNTIGAGDLNYATAGEVARVITEAAPQYVGDNADTAFEWSNDAGQTTKVEQGVTASPGPGGTLPIRGWSAEYESQPTVGGYSSRNLQVIPRANYGDVAVQMSQNPTFGGTPENPNVAISGDKGTVTASGVTMGNQDVRQNSTLVGGGGPNNPTGNYVTGLDNTQWQNGSYVSGRAATEDQLQAVAESMDLSFSGDRNINVGRSGNHVSIRLNPNVVQPENGSLNVGDPWGGGEYTRMDIDGIKISNGPSMTRQDGINAGGMRITNVAPGVYDDDAVNVSQLRRLEGKMNKMGDRADAGIAGAMAAAAVPQVTVPGKNLLGAGAGYFHDQSAVAVGYSAMSDNGKWIMRVNGSVSTEEASASAGVGYQW